MLEYNIENFIEELTNEIIGLNINWDVKGVIDEAGYVYSIGTDTKLLGRIFELKIAPGIKNFCEKHNFDYIIPDKQNIYPDFTLGYVVNGEKRYIALDVKTTYLEKTKKDVYKKFKITLGSFNSFMRNNTKNIHKPYNLYTHHFVIGFTYERNMNAEEGIIKHVNDLAEIPTPYVNSKFFIQEKYKIAGFQTGSGNTENIGSITSNNHRDFIEGNGPFSILGKDIFEMYWSNYPRSGKVKDYKDFNTFIGWCQSNKKLSAEKIEELKRKYEDYKL